MKNVYTALLMITLFAGAYIAGAFGGAIHCMARGDAEKVPLTVLMYHNISPKKSLQGKYCVGTDEFERDLKYLKNNGYNGISVNELESYVTKGVPLPEKPVIITFDDGFESFYTYAFPLIEKYGFKAVVNVVGSFSEKYSELDAQGYPDAHNVDYSYLTFDEISKLHAAKSIEIGCHTYAMHSVNGKRKGCGRMNGESAENYAEALLGDIKKADTLLEGATGETPYIFAYPFGIYSEQTPKLLESAGIRVIFNCSEKINYISQNDPTCLLSLCRYNRPGGMSSEVFFAKLK